MIYFCLICCSIVRNTIFLPCKHAACCDKCGSEIKLRFKPCPICKTPIDDLLIVDSDEKKFEGDADIIDVDENVMDDEKLIGDITLSNDASQNDINQNNHNNETNIFHVNQNTNNNEGKDEKINEQQNIIVNNDNINSDENLNLLAQNNDFIS